MENETAEGRRSTIRFSVDDFPELKRSGAIRDHLVEMMRVEIDPHEKERPFQFRTNLQVLPDARIGTAYASAVTVDRARPYLTDGQDDVVLIIPETRVTVQTPGMDDITIGPGEAVVVSHARETRIIHHEAGTNCTMRLRHRDLAQMLPRLGSAPVLALRRGSPMLSIMRQYGRWLNEDRPEDEASQRLTARHLQEMAAVAIGGSPDFVAELEQQSLSAVRLRTAKADIAAHIGQRDLSIEWLAARQQITRRHLQRVFAESGTSYSDVLRQTRITKARAMLEDPRYAGRTIGSIAIECGFPEASALSRAFQQEYGLKPSDVRWRG